MTLRKPPSGNMFNQKKIKEKISAEKEKTTSDKDRIAELEKQLAILIAKTQQDAQGGKDISDVDVERAIKSIRGKQEVPFLKYEEDTEREKRGTKTDISNKKYVGDGKWVDKKGGGHVKNYTGGKSGDKYYGGGPVYPRPAKGS